MNFKKIAAAFTAAAMVVTMAATSVFAATVQMDSEYPGGWSASKGIPKAEFEAIGGDVKVVLTVEIREPLVGKHNHLAKPMNMCVSWDAILDGITSDTAIRKGDGFFVFADGQTTLEFVVSEATWQSFKGYVDDEGNEDESAGLYFQVNDVIIKSAELSAGAPQGEIKTVSEEESGQVMDGTYGAEAEEPEAEEAVEAEEPADEAVEDPEPIEGDTDEVAPAETEAAAPVAEAPATVPAATGNTPAAAVAVVMVAAGAAALISKRK